MRGGSRGRSETNIEPPRHPASGNRSSSDPDPGWPAVAAWARELVESIALDQTAQHVAVFVPDPGRDQLRLAAQLWGPGEDVGVVVVGEWVVPLEHSVTGRAYRNGSAALCADVSLDPDYRPFPGSRSLSCLTVPVGPPGAVVAVINIEAPWMSAFTIRDYEAVTERARQAAATYPASPD
jgi:hypothetical protein